jgi:peptidoglycan-associated lipoprotein
MAARITCSILVAAALGAGGLACGHDPPPPPVTPEPIAKKEPPPPPRPVEHTARPVQVSQEIRDACHITETPKDAPKFDFDQAELTADDRAIVTQVAKCMIDGALKGKSVRLTGRADPRGEQEYNMTLGAHRANAVREVMAQVGVDKGRMSLTSRGALDALGTDEESYRLDRRVDIELQK